MCATIATSEKVTPMVTGGVNPVAELFQGYDTFNGSGRSTPVKGSYSSKGAETNLFYQTCYDTESLMQALQINASVGVVYGPDTVQGKTSFVRELSLTTWSITVLVYCNSISRKDVYTDVALKGTPPTDMNEFFRINGDSFVSTLVLGSEFAAAYVFYAQSESERDQLTASLTAHGIVEGGSVDASLSTSLEKVTSSFKSQTYFNMHMDGVKGVPLPDKDHVIDFALKFSSFPVNEATVVSYETTGYERVPGMPDMLPLVKNRRALLGDDVDPGVGGNLAVVSTILDQISSIQGVYDTYAYSGDSVLVKNRDQLQTDYRKLQSWLDAVEDAANIVQPVPVVVIPGTPTVQFAFQTPVQFGGNGGEEFAEAGDIDHAWVMNGMRPSAILLRGGSRVDRISLTYISSANTSVTYQHGGGGGDDGPILNLQPGEYISQIKSIYQPNYVNNQLTFHTNLGQKMMWPLNPDKGETLEYTFDQAKGTILAFRGRAGRYLDQLVPVVVAFSPAKWVNLPRG